MPQVVIKNVRDRVDAIEDVGTLPQVMARILAIVEDDSSTALDLASEISHDQALTVRILRSVNSAYYGFQRQILTVPEAVVILGFNEVERLALAIAVINTLGMARENVKALRLMWRHSLACSVAGTVFEQRFATPMPGVRGAHVAGLLHDVGKAIIAQHVPEAVPAIVSKVTEDGLELVDAEREVLDGYTHCDVGSWMAARWDLPTDLVESIALHHDVADVPLEKEQVHATHVMDEICKGLGIMSANIPYTQKLNPSSAELFGYDDELVKAVEDQLEKNQRLLCAVGAGAMF
jgi:HD-like signal output (HDOD) protein